MIKVKHICTPGKNGYVISHLRLPLGVVRVPVHHVRPRTHGHSGALVGPRAGHSTCLRGCVAGYNGHLRFDKKEHKKKFTISNEGRRAEEEDFKGSLAFLGRINTIISLHANIPVVYSACRSTVH